MRSTWRTTLGQATRTLDRRSRSDIALVCVADILVGLSFGAITVSGGLPTWLPVTLSLLVFAGGVQFAAVGAVLAGGGATAGVLAGLVLNARLLPFGTAVAGVLGDRWPSRLLGAHLVTDETVAFTLRHEDAGRRRAVFWVCGLALFGCWNLAVLAGALAGGAIEDTDTLDLDAAFPAVLLALVVPALTGRRTRDAALLGAGLAVASAPLLPAGLPVLVGLVGLGLTRAGKRRG